MNKVGFLIPLIFLLGLVAGYLWRDSEAQQEAGSLAAKRLIIEAALEAEVVRVIDGDTFEVEAHLWSGLTKTARVRLSKVNTPEKRKRAGCLVCKGERDLARRAQAYVEQLIGKQAGVYRKIYLRNISAPHIYGRTGADISTADGLDLGKALIEKGLARPLVEGKRACWCGASK